MSSNGGYRYLRVSVVALRVHMTSRIESKVGVGQSSSCLMRIDEPIHVYTDCHMGALSLNILPALPRQIYFGL